MQVATSHRVSKLRGASRGAAPTDPARVQVAEVDLAVMVPMEGFD